MKIGKYISELLFENDFVILPNLGEFSTKYIPAKFIPELKKVESPSKVVTFNEKNKTGGGLLIEYIAKKEGIGSQQAKDFVTDFVAEMQNSLKSGKKVELESIGVFSLDQSGIIAFEPDTSINYLNDSIGMTSVKEPSKKREEDAKTELDKVLEDVKKETPPPVQEPEKKEIPPVSPPVPEPPKDKAPEEEKKEVPRPVHPFAKKEFTPSTSDQEHDDDHFDDRHTDKKPAGLPPALKWVAFTVVPLLIIIIILAFNFEYIFGEKSVFRSKEPVVTHTPAPVVTEPEVEEVVQDEPEEVFDPTVAPPAPERGRPVFYIIVGSFEEEHSAEILAEELRMKGARTASVFPINRLGFYRVSYGYYYDLQQAERDLEQAKQVNPDAWILHR